MIRLLILHYLTLALGVRLEYELRFLRRGYTRSETRGSLIESWTNPRHAAARLKDIQRHADQHEKGTYYLSVNARLGFAEAVGERPARRRRVPAAPADSQLGLPALAPRGEGEAVRDADAGPGAGGPAGLPAADAAGAAPGDGRGAGPEDGAAEAPAEEGGGEAGAGEEVAGGGEGAAPEVTAARTVKVRLPKADVTESIKP